ncbi:MAG: hypothetical protein R3B82_20925 [Sandaracinaceae bacterium]
MALWCFEEGEGDVAASSVAGAPPILGVSTAEWVVGGGVRTGTGARLEAADDPVLDVQGRGAWAIDMVVTPRI